MTHALIIDDHIAVRRAVEHRLAACGFDSFDHTWTEQQARRAAALRRPDIIVVGDHIASGSPLAIAREVATESEAPILAVTANRFALQQALPVDAALDGPYPLGELDAALRSAQADA